jgi:hypothetical protein
VLNVPQHQELVSIVREMANGWRIGFFRELQPQDMGSTWWIGFFVDSNMKKWRLSLFVGTQVGKWLWAVNGCGVLTVGLLMAIGLESLLPGAPTG